MKGSIAMKKPSVLIALVLAALLLAGCAGSEKLPEAAEALENLDISGEDVEEIAGLITGGWTVPVDFAITGEQRSAFEKALEGFAGADYEPIACLGSQVVAGTNYVLLCLGREATPDALPTLNLAYIYSDLQDGAELLGFRGLSAIGEFTQDTLAPVAGGWTVPAEEAEGRAAFEKAMEELDGVNYVPIRVIGEQVVSGMNYCVLTQATVVAPDAQPYIALVFLYKDLDGNVEITDIRELQIPGAPEL